MPPDSWKERLSYVSDGGYFEMDEEECGGVPVRLFLTPSLLDELEDSVCAQIVTATRFPGVKLVVVTPDVHHGYGVPVGCAIVSDPDDGAVALGPVGFDIGCGMVSLRSDVPAEAATEERRVAFNRAVMQRVNMGVGERGVSHLAGIGRPEFERLIRGGADYYTATHGERIDRTKAERNCIPVDDRWQIPASRADRGIGQLGSLGAGNHFIELQRSEQSKTLFVQIHTGSRGFGHGLAEHYFHVAKDEQPDVIRHLDEAWFAPQSPRRWEYLAAVAAGGNYAIINRLVIAEEVSAAFRQVFRADLELVYEISHNLVQREWHPEFGWVNVHRKGATRAFPARHPQLEGTPWFDTGHPVLIPGSNRDWSYILRPTDSAKSAYTVNHGAGRRMSRTAAKKQLDQQVVNREYREAGIVVNVDRRVPIDESAAAYKSSKSVIAAITRAGLAEVEHRLWPLASLKGL
ncbi:MAG: RtcB family protein [Chloroflexi bacterium]|nr:MAG: RtcB family protein [Chloroflexota bacterium]